MRIIQLILLFILTFFVIQVIIGLLIDESGRRRPLTDNLVEMKA